MITLENNIAHMGFARLKRDVVYSTETGTDISMDLIIPIPPEDEPDKGYPAIVFVQGSAWSCPNTGSQIPQLSMFAQQGYVVASIRHRNRREGYPAPAYLLDAKTAVRFLRANAAEYHVDPEHIGAWGTSSGGNTVLLLGLTGDDPMYQTKEYAGYSDHVDVVADCFGPTDLTSYTSQLLNDYEEGMGENLFGGPVEEHMDLAKALSPIYLLEEGKKYPPFLIAHGDVDPVVPFEDSLKFIQGLKKCHATVKGIRVRGGEHEGNFWSQELLAHIIAFFDEYLMPVG